jgi:FkbM family methyltransferase
MLFVPNEVACDDIREMLHRHLRPGDTFIDVGANHGSFSLIAAKCLGDSGLIIAIEPQPLLASLVRKTLAANARCQFEVHEIACGEEDSTAKFFVPSATSGEASLYASLAASTRHNAVDVRVRRFDRAINWRAVRGCVFLKIDIEGSELAFIRGAREALRQLRPVVYTK